ncbi:hypothetical protein BCD67_24695 [Oscillatoriales cyanobacterium USR001]|nr:hypothetical protein BCD67_24695 [Oscillatoriales cyanobacterium USR001]
MSEYSPTTKYRSKPFYQTENGEQYQGARQNKEDKYFASQWEYEVYKELLKHFPKERIVRQLPVILIPKNHNYPAITHVIDFAVLGNNIKPEFWVEAKGCATQVYKLKLQLLNHFHPLIWRDLQIVTKSAKPKPIDSSRKRTIDLVGLSNFIVTRNHLRI